MLTKRLTLGAALLTALLAGCGSNEPREDAAAGGATVPHGSCDSSAVQDLVGKPASDPLLQQARQRAGAETARTLGPHDVVTLEYNSRRLNLLTDDKQVITRVSCG
ncbi:Peptidase inhibitor I78 family protein [compost metagenome]